MCCCTPQAYKDLLTVQNIMTVDDIQTSPDVPGQSDNVTKVQIGISLPPGYNLGFIDDEFLFAYTPNGEIYKFVKSTNPFDPNYSYTPYGDVKVTNENKGNWVFSIGIVPVLVSPMTCTLPTLKLSASSNVEPTTAVTYQMVSVKRYQFDIFTNNNTVTNFQMIIGGVTVLVPGSFNLFNTSTQVAFKAALNTALNNNGFKSTVENVAWRQPGYLNNGADQEVAVISAGFALDFLNPANQKKSVTLDLFQGLETEITSVTSNDGVWSQSLTALNTQEPVNAAYLQLLPGSGTAINIQLTSTQSLPGGDFDPIVNAPTSFANPTYSLLANSRFTINNDGAPSNYEYEHDGNIYPFTANADAASIAVALLNVLQNDVTQGVHPDYLFDDEVDVTVFSPTQIDVSMFFQFALDNSILRRVSPIVETYTKAAISGNAFSPSYFKGNPVSLQIGHENWGFTGSEPDYQIQYELLENPGVIITQDFQYSAINGDYQEI